MQGLLPRLGSTELAEDLNSDLCIQKWEQLFPAAGFSLLIINLGQEMSPRGDNFNSRPVAGNVSNW
jgi:hypothetical protein